MQVEGSINTNALEQLSNGVTINVNGQPYTTQKAKASIITEQIIIPERNPPIRFRKNVPTSWIKLLLTEGKNRQVRKMTAATGFPTLRLIRYRIETITLNNLQPGEMIELSQKSMYKKLFPEK